MPDSTENFVVDAVNGPVNAQTVTRNDFITTLQQLNYAEGNIRSIDELSGTAGIVALDGSGAANVRTITGATGLTVANGNGTGDPEISLNAPHTFRQTYNDTSSNTVSDTKLYNIISSGAGSPFILSTPETGYITVKNIINATSSFITIRSPDWGPAGLGDVRISEGETLTIVSNTAGKWYPQHVTEHDVNPFGAIYRSSAAATPLTTSYQALSLTTATHSNMTNFSMPGNGQLQYTGDIPVDAEIHVSISGGIDVNSAHTVDLVIVKYDDSEASSTVITQTEQQFFFSTLADRKNITLIGHIEMDQNDYVSVHVKANSTVNFTPTKFYMSASGHRIITA